MDFINKLIDECPRLEEYRDLMIEHDFTYDKVKNITNVYLNNIGLRNIKCKLFFLKKKGLYKRKSV